MPPPPLPGGYSHTPPFLATLGFTTISIKYIFVQDSSTQFKTVVKFFNAVVKFLGKYWWKRLNFHAVPSMFLQVFRFWMDWNIHAVPSIFCRCFDFGPIGIFLRLHQCSCKCFDFGPIGISMRFHRCFCKCFDFGPIGIFIPSRISILCRLEFSTRWINIFAIFWQPL